MNTQGNSPNRVPAATVAETTIREHLLAHWEDHGCFPPYAELREAFPAGYGRLVRIRRGVEAELKLPPARRRTRRGGDDPSLREVIQDLAHDVAALEQQLAAVHGNEEAWQQVQKTLARLDKRLDARAAIGTAASPIPASAGDVKRVEAALLNLAKRLPEPDAATPAASVPAPMTPAQHDPMQVAVADLNQEAHQVLTGVTSAIEGLQVTTLGFAQTIKDRGAEAQQHASAQLASIERLEHVVNRICDAVKDIQDTVPAAAAAAAGSVATAQAKGLGKLSARLTRQLGQLDHRQDVRQDELAAELRNGFDRLRRRLPAANPRPKLPATESRKRAAAKHRARSVASNPSSRKRRSYSSRAAQSKVR